MPLIALALGEATTPLLGAWWLAKTSAKKSTGGHSSAIELHLARAFTLSFLLIRIGVLPAYCAALVRASVRGELDEALGPRRARLWAVLLAGVVGGGFVWGRSLVRGCR